MAPFNNSVVPAKNPNMLSNFNGNQSIPQWLPEESVKKMPLMNEEIKLDGDYYSSHYLNSSANAMPPMEVRRNDPDLEDRGDLFSRI